MKNITKNFNTSLLGTLTVCVPQDYYEIMQEIIANRTYNLPANVELISTSEEQLMNDVSSGSKLPDLILTNDRLAVRLVESNFNAFVKATDYYNIADFQNFKLAEDRKSVV